MNKSELEKKCEEIYDKCFKVYGTCTDGSFEASLYANNYYELKKQLDNLEEKND